MVRKSYHLPIPANAPIVDELPDLDKERMYMASFNKAKLNSAMSKLRSSQRKFESDMRKAQSDLRSAQSKLIREERKIREDLNRL